MLGQWSESEVTWNSRLAGVPWQSPGADGGADAAANESSTVEILDVGTYTFPSSSALVADVQAWVNDPSRNFGWMLQSQDEGTPKTARLFGSRESGNSAPILGIDYSFSPLSATVTPSQQSVVAGSSVTFDTVVTGTPPFTYQWRFNGTPLPGATADSLRPAAGSACRWTGASSIGSFSADPARPSRMVSPAHHRPCPNQTS